MCLLDRKSVLFLGIAACLIAVSDPLSAQTGAAIAGTVTSASQAPVSNASVSVKNLAIGVSTEAKTDLTGAYALPNLAPGEYEVTVSADGFQPRVTQITLAPGVGQALNVTLSPVQPTGGLSLSDLGISAADAAGSSQQQALLDKRTRMLQIHQRLGLITLAPMLATVITSVNATSHRMEATSPTGREVHGVLGVVTTGMYASTAYFALRTPKVAGTTSQGRIRLHKALAWVHGPGMVLTPILGGMAYSQQSQGERVHGIASWHSAVAITTFAAFTAAMVTVTLK
jgi:hypothetical protein